MKLSEALAAIAERVGYESDEQRKQVTAAIKRGAAVLDPPVKKTGTEEVKS